MDNTTVTNIKKKTKKEEKVIQLTPEDTSISEKTKKKTTTRKKAVEVKVDKQEENKDDDTVSETTKNIFISSEIDKTEAEIKKSILSEVTKPKSRTTKKSTKATQPVIVTKKSETDSDNIIVHLPIHSQEGSVVGENIPESFRYDPNISIPIGYESNQDGYQFIKSSEENVRHYLNSELVGTIHPPISAQCKYPFDSRSKSFEYTSEHEIDIGNNSQGTIDEIKKDTLKQMKQSRENDIHSILRNSKTNVEKCLSQMEESNKSGIWSKTTSVHCWWCCHPFDNPPCSIPQEYRNGLYTVYGVFCSPECAAAYNFDDSRHTADVWERYSLLNLLYRNVFSDKHYKVKLAPPRQTLKVFGGNLTIKEFRANFQSTTHSYKMVFPPMISIIPVQELSSIDRGFSSKQEARDVFGNNDQAEDTTSIGSNNTSTLRLKRSKPFVACTNTLNKCMQITVYKEKKEDGSVSESDIDEEEVGEYMDE